jgi:acyl-CoA hydrolase
MPRLVRPEMLLDELRPGLSVYIPGASGELRCLQTLFSIAPQCLAGVRLVSCLLPGMNSFDYAALDPGCRLETFMLSPQLRPSFMEGRTQIFPLAYSAVAERFATVPVDVAFLHVTPAQGGACSFGVAADFGPIVAASARRRVGILNRAMPQPRNSPSISIDAFDVIVEIDEPLAIAPPTPETPELEVIARQVAALVPHGATLQVGIGQAPTAIWKGLRAHQQLRLWSGVVTDGFFDALDFGAMAATGHLAGIAHGSAALYKRLDRSAVVDFADVHITHAAGSLARIDQFIAINSALEVDLFGQANLEWQAGRLISGAGGAPDFNAAARRSRGGRSIIAMPATARGGTVCRISACLEAPAITLGRTELDAVVTEYGTAELAGLSMDARAEALIAIAAPAHRAGLERAWLEQRQRM